MPSLRVLVVAPLYHPDRGGLGRQAVLLTERLADMGVRFEVATRLMRGLPSHPFHPGVKIHKIAAGRPHVHNYETPNVENLVTSLAFSLGLVALLIRRRKHLDAIHVHGASLPLLILLPFAKLLGIPVLALVAATHQGVEAGDMRRHRIVGRALAWGFAQVDGYIAITAEVEQLLVAEGVRPERIARIPFFVDVESFKPLSAEGRKQARAQLGLEGRTVVVASGRLVPRKGGDALIRAFHAAYEDAREARPLLVFLGDGPERPFLEGLAARIGARDNVRFPGFVEDVPRWLAASDVFVLASKIEGLPNALLEALGMGLPCVATKIAGAEEVIDDGRTGILVPPDDESALAGAIATLLHDEPYRRNIGRAAAEQVRTRLARDVIAPRYLEVYEDLIARRGVARASEGTVPEFRVLPRLREVRVNSSRTTNGPAASAPLPPPERNAETRAEPSRRRSLRKKLLAVGVGAAAGLLLVELTARAVITEDRHLAGHEIGSVAFHEQVSSPATDPAFRPRYKKDDQLGFSLVANVTTDWNFSDAPGKYEVRTNALALRDDRPLDRKSKKRILALGDSMTFGIGVEREQAFPAALEKKLGDVEVVNAGCCMWGQREENAFLEHRAPALAPDLVILEFTIANDVLDDLRYENRDDKLIPDLSLGRDLEEHPIFQVPLLAEHSRAYRALVWRLGRHIVRYRAMKEPWRLERAAQLVKRARDLSTALGARFLLLVAPTAAQLEHGMAEKLLATRTINDYIIAAAKKDGIPVCDPTVHLQAVYARGRLPYYPIDQHWNPDGHEAVASALEPLVEEVMK
jgi:glycosyltransferase involved in cell wall biosynthesis/lysophospholipase L1-like esterase